MPVVNIKGVGPAQFPDGMSADDIRIFLRNKFYQDNTRATPELTPVTNFATPYEPTLVEKAARGIGDALHDSGIISDRYGANRIGENLTAIGEFLPGVGDAAAGDEFGRAVSEGNILGAGLSGLGIVPGIGEGAQAIFGGILAKGADHGLLKKAKEMFSGGSNRDEIWKDTGWFNDKGDWKFEIDDADRFYTPTQKAHPKDIEVAENKVTDLIKRRKQYTADNSKIFLNKDTPDYVKADISNKLKAFSNDTVNARLALDKMKAQGSPRLLVGDAMSANVTDIEYPDLMDARFKYEDAPLEFGGSFDGSSVEINRGRPLAQQESTIMHELQHAVQKKEGFQTGGNPGTAPKVKNPKYDQWLQNRDSVNRADEIRGSKEYKDQMTARNKLWQDKYDSKYDDATDEESAKLMQSFKSEANEISPLINEVDRLSANAGTLDAPPEYIDPYESYKRLVGEAEARNVQTRLDWTSEQRRATPPWKTLDVPESELIYRK